MAALAAPASAATKTIKCGQDVKGDVKAANSIGPCGGGDAVTITTNGTTLDLDGHSIRCDNGNNHTRKAQIGVHLIGVSGVTVKNGTVSNCDAGVSIDGGGNNTVSGVVAHDNVAHVLISGPVNPARPSGTPCDFGDGITTDNSNGNTITGNEVYRNGPYSGISLVDNSDNNVVSGNRVHDQTVANLLPPPAHPGSFGPCGPFSATAQGQGRPDQDIGIRIEGPGASNNQVTNNFVSANMLNGIAIHGYVCLVGIPPAQQSNFPPIGENNTANLVQGNNVVGNGFDRQGDGSPIPGAFGEIDGIGVLQQGPLGFITCGSSGNTISGNQSSNNAEDGIFVTQTGDNSKPSNNTINNNRVDNNGRDGIHLEGPFSVCPFGQTNRKTGDCKVPEEIRNGANNNTLVSNQGHGNHTNIVDFAHGYDGFDANPACDNNHWMANMFGTVNQACVRAGGGTGTVIP